MTDSVSSTGMKISMGYYWEFQWEVEFSLYLYFNPIDDLFLCEVPYLIMQHVLMMKSRFRTPELQNRQTVLMNYILLQRQKSTEKIITSK